jgi:hypothetical protein
VSICVGGGGRNKETICDDGIMVAIIYNSHTFLPDY